jgi:hypothetical protein
MMKMVGVISEKFSNFFLRRLCIMDHIRQINWLYDHEYKTKGLDTNWDQELADLYILLQIHFLNRPEAVADRMKKFESKIMAEKVKESVGD